MVINERLTLRYNCFNSTLSTTHSNFYSLGEYIVYNGDQTREYDFDQSTSKAAVTVYYTAYHADLEHKTKPLTSGYRLAFLYSLCSHKNHTHMHLTKSQAIRKMSHVLDNLSNLLHGPFALALENKYHGEQSDRTIKLKDSDVERLELIKAANKQFCLCLAKANLTTTINGTRIAYDQMQAGQAFSYKYDYPECKLILSAKDLDELKCLKIEKFITNWHDLEGDRVERGGGGGVVVDRVPIEFFTHLIDLTSEEENDEEINSWMYDEPVVIRRKGFESSTIRSYEKYLLVFWQKRLHCEIMSKISIRKLVDSMIDESNKETKAVSLEEFFTFLIEASKAKAKSELPVQTLDNSCYDKLIHLVVCLKKPKLAKLFIDLLINVRPSGVIQTKSIYKLYKSNILNILEFKCILSDLIAVQNDELHFDWTLFDKQFEMVKRMKSECVSKLFITKIIDSYSTLNGVYLERAVELIVENDWESCCDIFTESFSPFTLAKFQQMCSIIQVYIITFFF
jgi:hypothetical protein